MSSHINTDFQMPKSVTLQTRMKCSRIKIYNTTVKLYSQVSNISNIYKAKIFQYFFCSRLLVSIIQTGGFFFPLKSRPASLASTNLLFLVIVNLLIQKKIYENCPKVIKGYVLFMTIAYIT